MGHQGSIDHKIKSIEFLDQRLIRRVKDAMDASGEPYRILLMPDHPTPIRCRTHTSDPVPYVIYDSTAEQRKIAHYTEKEAASTGIYEPEGYKLMEKFLRVEN